MKLSQKLSQKPSRQPSRLAGQIGAVALLISSCFLFSNAANASAPEFPHLETVGSSEILVSPDMAEIVVAVRVEAANAKQAKAESDKAVAAFVSKLKQAQIATNDIASANLNLRAQYHYDKENGRQLTGYEAHRDITVTVRDLNILNELLDSALEQGINHVNQINLKSSKEAQYKQQARELAIKDAREKAQAIAKSFGTQVQGVWQVRYHDYQVPKRHTEMRAMADAGAINQSYQQGQIAITDTIEAIFRLQD
ncbi:oxidative stress defense protein [Shewanella sp. WXL01]|uniref:oxidative stress defense protein n=1 Tax=Shewanella sp. WXL01 TaxID=2709721 RepID=UPI00143852D6|nr:oxidative stress defense protein [Shewanella sp. WXL01]NKF49857.1 oxidative stress defense protein [Shewanella sp. WXL01]